MLFVTHPVADMINDGLKINHELKFRMIQDDTKMWFRDYDKEWRRQELDEQIMKINHRLSKHIILKYDIKSLEYFCMSTGISLTEHNG